MKNKAKIIEVPWLVPVLKPLRPWKSERVVATTAVATAPINCCKVLTKAFPSESSSVDKVPKLQVIKLL